MFFITETDLVEMQMTHTNNFVTTITDGSENAFIGDSTVSDSEKKEFTNTASVSCEELNDQPFMMKATKDWTRDSLDSFAVHIVECLGDGKYRMELTSPDSMTSLIGLFQAEAEQSDLSEEMQGQEELVI